MGKLVVHFDIGCINSAYFRQADLRVLTESRFFHPA